MAPGIASELQGFFTIYNVIFLARAAIATFVLTVAGCLAGLFFGILFSVARLGHSWWSLPMRLPAILYIELFRRIPFLVTLFLVFFGSQAANLDLSAFSVAIFSVCLIATAYIAEIIRGGLASVHQNQWDAALAMNFSTLRTLVHVIAPQAWKVILPPAFSFFILFLKDSALASQIGVVELTYAGKVLNNRGFPAFLVFGSVLILYFCLSYPLSRLGAWTETKLALSRNHRP